MASIVLALASSWFRLYLASTSNQGIPSDRSFMFNEGLRINQGEKQQQLELYSDSTSLFLPHFPMALDPHPCWPASANVCEASVESSAWTLQQLYGASSTGKTNIVLANCTRIWQFSTFLWCILHFVATCFGEERFTRHQCVSRRKCHDQRFDWAEALRLSFSASIVSLLNVALTWMPGIAWDIPPLQRINGKAWKS